MQFFLVNTRPSSYPLETFIFGWKHGRSHGWTWGGNGPPLIFFFLNIIKYMDTNFSNFVLENYTFVPLKISLILLRALL